MPEQEDMLTGKTILVISPQAWGKMLVSKHHYAVELARRGNTVYFLNPPGEGDISDAAGGAPEGEKGGAASGDKIRILPSGIQEGLWLIHHRISFPYNIKFHFIGLFHFLMSFHVKAILKKIGRPVDIIWSFDLGHLYPFRFFPPDSYKIFHPVDEPLNRTAIDSARGSQIIFSVTREILEKYRHEQAPKYFINHGVADEFLKPAGAAPANGHPVRVGFSGNLLRGDLDRETLLTIVRQNPDVIFECWGSYRAGQSNIGGGVEGVDDFIGALQQQANVVLHGVVSSAALARELQRMDVFLICYDIQKDQSGGTNYHKVMEYLSQGRVIVSNNITTYAGRPDLIRMSGSREDNRELPALFQSVLAQLAELNSEAAQQVRIQYAMENSYSRQVERIGQHIAGITA